MRLSELIAKLTAFQSNSYNYRVVIQDSECGELHNIDKVEPVSSPEHATYIVFTIGSYIPIEDTK